MAKEMELQRSKRLALILFLTATITFLSTLFISTENWWAGLIRAISEAAMVGALADWFAVEALFKRIPIPIVSSHTEIIPKNKNKIADNLALFVREKFLDVDSIVTLIKKHNPAQKAADWLIEPINTHRLGSHIVKAIGGALDFIDDKAVHKFMLRGIHTMLDNSNLSQSAGMLLESITKNQRHQTLLDEAINQFASLLKDEQTQTYIASGIINWLEENLSLFEKVLPKNILANGGAILSIKILNYLLNRIDKDKNHPIRTKFDQYTRDFITRLKSDPDFFEKAEEIKLYLKNDETFNSYMGGLWHDLKDWLKRDCDNPASILHQKIVATGEWLGKNLSEDVALRHSINQHIEDVATKMAPDFAQFLTVHISDTVKGWDTREMSYQIELNIGKDLQFIRINGTIVGGLIGCILYLLHHAIQWLISLL